jgi:hypothetical protein
MHSMDSLKKLRRFTLPSAVRAGDAITNNTHLTKLDGAASSRQGLQSNVEETL